MLPIGERIRNLRRVKNETQEDLALVLGVTYQAVSRWEKGDAYPDIELLPKLAAHYFRERWNSIPDFGYKG